MKGWQKEHILANLPDLIASTSCDVVMIAQLLANEIISRLEYVKLQATQVSHGSTDAATLLYQILITKEDAYDKLINVLIETSQTEASRILHEGKKRRGIVISDSPGMDKSVLLAAIGRKPSGSVKSKHASFNDDNIEELITVTVVDSPFLAFFKEEQILGSEDIFAMKGISSQVGKSAEFYRRGQSHPRFHEVLATALKITNQTEAVKILERFVPKGDTSRWDTLSPTNIFNKLPDGLQQFLEGNAKFCILLTIDTTLTCGNIRGQMTNGWYYKGAEVDHLSRTKMVNIPVHFVEDCKIKTINEDTLNKIINLQDEPGTKFVFVTSENEKEIREFVEESGSLKSKVEIEVDPMEWGALSPAWRLKIRNNLKMAFDIETDDEQLDESLKGQVLVDLINEKEVELFKDAIPAELELTYYVDRTVITRNLISFKIFEQESVDVFLIEGMERHQLSYMVKTTTDNSSNAVWKRNLTAKYMVLDFPIHFEMICEKTNAPVHWLRYDDDEKLTWIRSRGDIGVVQRCADDNDQKNFNEDEWCRNMGQASTNVPVVISDSPGMGKSVLLAGVGRKLQKINPKKPVIFLGLRDLISQMTSEGSARNTAIQEAIRKLACQNVMEGLVLDSKLKSEDKISVELLLDGFDETADTDVAIEILKQIKTELKSVRMWITSRPHFLQKLEESLSTLGYNIDPFGEKKQIEFLAKFWSQGKKVAEAQLEKFASGCVKALMPNLSDIAGTPLECSFIAEVYEKDALAFASHDENITLIDFGLTSILELFGSLINKKFEKYQSLHYHGPGTLSKQEMMEMHAQLSLQLIFPEWVEKVGKIVDVVKLEEVFKVGIVEWSRKIGTPRFVHRTFADYFLAWFLTDKLRTGAAEWNEKLNDLLFQHALRCKDIYIGTEDHHRERSESVKPGYVSSYAFQYPVLTNFINSFLADFTKTNLPQQLSVQQHLQKIAHGCANMNFPHIFEYFYRLGLFDKKDSELFNRNFLLLTIQLQPNVKLFQLVLDQFEKNNEFDQELQAESLCMAVKCGACPILKFLLKERRLSSIVEKPDPPMNLLLHHCVKGTLNASQAEIEGKKLALGMLVEINPSLLEEKDGRRRTALISLKPHPLLVIKLVRLGANVLVQDKINKNTVLHIDESDRPIWSKESYNGLLASIPKSKLEQLVRMENNAGLTPLMSLISFIDPLPHTLEMFWNAKAEINHINKHGNSVMITAIQKRRSTQLIRWLIEHEAKVEWDWEGKPYNILHTAARHGSVEAIELLLDEIGMDKNKKDSDGLTPLDYAIKYDNDFDVGMALYERGGTGMFKTTHDYTDSDYTSGEVHFEGTSSLHIAAFKQQAQSVNLLIKFGLDLNHQDANGNTPLHVLYMSSTMHNKFLHITKLLLDANANVNIKNQENDTPFQTALKCEELDLKTFKLLKSKTEVNWTSEVASLALMCLISASEDKVDEEFISLFQELVEYGAEFTYKKEKGESISDIADRKQFYNILKFLYEKGAVESTYSEKMHAEPEKSNYFTNAELLKIDEPIANAINEGKTIDVAVVFAEKPESVLAIIRAKPYPTILKKREAILEVLEELSARSHENAIKLLNEHSTKYEYESQCVSNTLYITQASADILQKIIKLEEVDRIEENHIVSSSSETSHESSSIEWGIQRIRANEAWEHKKIGNKGEGIVIAILDSGVFGDHVSLRESCRSEYNWFDPHRQTRTPADNHGHGTHVAGIAVGSGTGVAPEATWIACLALAFRGQNGGTVGTQQHIEACAKWIMKPTDSNGSNPKIEMVPDVVCCSWGCPRVDQHTRQPASFLDNVISLWEDYNFVLVFAMGNDGPAENTVSYPACHPMMISVGSVDQNEVVAITSSRGPFDYTKPNIVAPGVDIRSAAISGVNDYIEQSGTSMACPHVAGAICILLSAYYKRMDRQQVFNIREIIQDVIEATGHKRFVLTYPNHENGYGRIDLMAALELMLNLLDVDNE